MKVAYNGCYGGFSLSPLAETEYCKRKGIPLTWYQGIGDYPYSEYERVDDINSVNESIMSMFCLNAVTCDLGEKITKIPEDKYYYKSWYGEENRADKDLIEVIELLGEKSNGTCAKLMIEEIPNGVVFEIEEYDGFESVVPPRMTW